MKNPLDRFSTQATQYRKYRPVYPDELYSEILRHVAQADTCWDCGTGNGQVAAVLAKHFRQVEATDISQKQIDQATRLENINYSKQRAEQTDFDDNQFDLITVAQAIHWFDFERFNAEVKRVGKPDGLMAMWGYGLISVTPELDRVIHHFEKEIVGPFWDVERRHIDSHYETIPFDFESVSTNRTFQIEAEWNFAHLQGYFESWSCVQNYIRENEENPVPSLMQKLKTLWPRDDGQKVRFPIFLKMGRIVK